MRVEGREAVFGPGLPEIEVGCDRSCFVRVDGPGVGPRHLVLRHADGTWTAEVLDPERGVFLDGCAIQRVDVDALLSLRLGHPLDGPVLEIGPAELEAVDLHTRDFGSLQREALAAAEGPTPRAGPRSFPLTEEVLRIGRDRESDIVVDDVLASRRHAEIRILEDGGYEVVDLASHNGTFVNGHRVERALLAQLDVVMIGRNSYRLVEDRLEEEVDTGEVAYAATDLTVRLASGAVLLDRVSFSLDSRSLLGVVGPSGCGKSTLMRALTGFRMATEGDVRYGEQSLYASYDALRRRVGYVPQDDVVHEELAVRRALEYAADLRFPADVDEHERRRRVEEVMEELALTARADVAVGALSGGQRKRVSVALELLTAPSLLFLDEPTSGLDPNYERSLMELFRGLADDGRTVVVVTHSVQSLRLCDRILVLAPGGKVAYFGPPQLIAAYFDRSDLPDVFKELAEAGDVDWGERFRAHPYHREYVEREGAARPAAAEPAAQERVALTSRGWWNQFSALTRRYAAVLAADRRNLALMLLQAPLLGALMLVALPSGELGAAPSSELRLISQASLVLLVVVLGVTWLGMSNAVREIAKELPIFRRERASGVSISAYLASKAVVLGVITVLQAAVLVALAVARQSGPEDAVLLGWPLGELIVVASCCGLAAMAAGLLISAFARTPDRATTILPIVLVFLLVLALGGVFPQIGDKPGLKQLGYVAGTQWGFAGAASTVELNDLQAITGVLTRVPSVSVDDPSPLFDALASGERGDPLWDHEAGAWLADIGALLALTLLALLVAGVALRRDDAGRRAA